MRGISGIILLSFLVGCLDDPTMDISRLSKHDRVLFSAAAAIKHVDITTESRPWYWIVKYKNMYGATRGKARCHEYDFRVMCKIKLNLKLINETPCEVGGRDRRFFIVSLHEITHVKNNWNHSSDPDNLMYEHAPCWPID